MRIHLKLTHNKNLVPFNYQENLTGAFNKWVGDNKDHDDISLYSFSWLEGGRTKKDTKNELKLNFPNGATWFISCWQEKLLKEIITGIRNDPKVAFGLQVREIVIQETPDFTDKEYFQVASPVFIKRYEGQKAKFYYYNDTESGDLLTETLHRKMKKAGIEDKTLSISFDRTYAKATTKTSTYNGITNKANICPVIIKGKPETKAFAWNVGLGNSTGIGFGAIK